MVGLLTDSSYVQLVGAGGVPAVDLGIPVRYTHTPIETCRISDVEQLVSLVWAVVERIGPALNLPGSSREEGSKGKSGGGSPGLRGIPLLVAEGVRREERWE